MREFFEKLEHQKYFYFALAFIIPFLTFIIIYLANTYYPVGRHQILIVDAYHQYYQFYQVLREKLLDGGGFLYTFRMGLGSDFLGLAAYYLISPINLFLLAVPENLLIVFFELAIAIKIGLMGFTFSIYLYWIYQKKDYAMVAFSLIYSLGGFVAGYFWNIMWLDVLILFPLVILGIKNIVIKDSYRLYFFSLLGCFLLNYYMSVFVSFAVIIFYLGFSFIRGLDIKTFFKKGFKALFYSVFCGLLSAFILLPTAIGLTRVYKSASPFTGEVKLINDFHDLFANALAFNSSTVRDGLPNIYSGLIIIFFVFIYILSKGILKREKLFSLILVAFLYLSTNVNVLDYIWHGFRYSNMLPARFTFILSFVVGIICYKTFMNLNFKDNKFLIPLGILVLLIVFYLGRERDWTIAVANLVLMTVYIGLTFISHYQRTTARGLLCFILIAELIVNISVGVYSGGTTDYYDFIKYKEEINALKSRINEDEFYRAESMERFTFNDPALYGYNGLAMFSSTLDKRMSLFMENMGHASSPAGNRIYYNYTTPIINSFLNIKYLFQKEKAIDIFGFEKERQVGQVTLQKNQFPMPLAFEPKGDIEHRSYKYDNIENQEEFFNALSGREDKIFTMITRSGVTADDLKINDETEDKIFYTTPEQEENLILEYDIPEDGYYYFDSDSVEDNQFTLDVYGELTDFDIRNRNITGGIFLEGGTYLKVKVNLGKDDDGNFAFRVFKLEEEPFIRAYEKAVENTGKNIQVKKEKVSFDIDSKSGKILTSIPYNKGWKAYVNGKEVKTDVFYDAFLVVHGLPGKNHVELKYSPTGFVYGLGISGVSLIVLLLLKRRTLKAIFIDKSH